ncbi:MAG: hypothetical protein ACFB2X_23275, partial [Rivularia sp. (in: cyanobacteria)]
ALKLILRPECGLNDNGARYQLRDKLSHLEQLKKLISYLQLSHTEGQTREIFSHACNLTELYTLINSYVAYCDTDGSAFLQTLTIALT